MELSTIDAILLIIAALLAVAVNTITGGGTLVTLPVLLAIGVPLRQAVSINMVALAIGGIGSVWGSLESLKKNSKTSLLVLIPTALGAAVGAILLVITPLQYLEFIIPVLVLVSTLSLLAPQSRRRLSYQWILSFAAIFLVAIYGGFFGAGMGVMLVSVLTIFNYGEMHAVNSLKNLQQVFINAISAIILMQNGLVLLEPTLFLVIGGLIGGYATGKYLERISAQALRFLMISIGFTLSAVLTARLLVF